jgi:hypothetical protein
MNRLLIIVFMIALTIVAFYLDIKSQDKCEKNGGVYLDYRCITKEDFIKK